MDLDSFKDTNWDLIDINCFLEDTLWNNQNLPQSFGREVDSSINTDEEVNSTIADPTSHEKECPNIECPRKRVCSEPCSKLSSKAFRERQRREKLNDSFSELHSVLEPGRPVKIDKLAILNDAIRVLNQLKSESEEYKDMNEKLLEEIKTLKEDKNELREEKMKLKAEKEQIELQLKTMTVVPTGFMPPIAAAYHTGPTKMAMFPGYGMVPMWQYLPPTVRDTSRDHELRPPAA
ncbi:basic helix-loop-helix transcription factor [Lithospermum erythrorhizon]|uniref:Basic helix-loop-helix transcription factor n=1 Tax=Lithospermum erythrorhizon TaxID=34254 RepID=A0AAV3PJR8_LITER